MAASANVAFGNVEIPVYDTLTFLTTTKTITLDGASLLVLATILAQYSDTTYAAQISVIKAELSKTGVHFV